MSGTPSALSFTIVDPMYVVKEMHMQVRCRYSLYKAEEANLTTNKERCKSKRYVNAQRQCVSPKELYEDGSYPLIILKMEKL